MPPLKYCDSFEYFIDFCIDFFNPKSEKIEGIERTLFAFCESCSLNAFEMKEAIEMTSKGMLYIDNNGVYEKVKIYRDIDRIKLDEIEQAYIYYRDNNIEYQKDMEMLNNVSQTIKLPEKTELTKSENDERNEAVVKDLALKFIKSGKLPQNTVQMVYDWLNNNGRLPEKTKERIIDVSNRGRLRLEAEMHSTFDRKLRAEIKADIANNNSKRLIQACREIVMEDFFREYVKHLEDK